MKMNIGLLFLAIILFSAFVAAEECNTREELHTEWMNVRYNFYHHAAEIKRVRMESVIDSITEQDAEADTSDLEAITNDFISNYDAAKGVADSGDNNGFNDAIKAGKDLIKQFREKSKEKITDREAALSDLDLSIEENKDYLDGIRDDTLNFQLLHRLSVYNQGLCNVKRFVEKQNISNGSLDNEITDFEDQTEEYEAILTAAYEECKLKRLINCRAEESDEAILALKELKLDLKDLRQSAVDTLREQKRQRNQNRINKIAEKYKTIIKTTEKLIEKAEEAGDDTTELNSLIESVENDLEDAKGAAEKGDIKVAKEHLTNMNTNLKKTRMQLRSMTSVRARNTMAKRNETRNIGAVDSTNIRQASGISNRQTNSEVDSDNEDLDNEDSDNDSDEEEKDDSDDALLNVDVASTGGVAQ